MNNNDSYINIKEIAEVKNVSARAIRLKLNNPDNGYISREVKVKGGTSYEILFSSLEPETQKLLLENNKKLHRSFREIISHHNLFLIVLK